MPVFTQAELAARQPILQTHITLGSYLDINIIRKLIQLFNNTYDSYNTDKFYKYVEAERKLKKYDNTNISFKQAVHNLEKDDPTLHFSILKNGIELIHLSIHLAMKGLTPKNSGIIHIKKNIYTKGQPGSIKKKLYALISVQIPTGKPNSLEFTLADGITTPFMPNHQTRDPEIQQEMKVIIDVLNKLFDEENKEYYIGSSNSNSDKIVEIHPNTNRILESINAHTTYYTRKNKGVYLHPLANNQQGLRINSRNPRGTSKRFQSSNRTKTVRRNRLRTTQKAKTTSNMTGHK